MGLPLTGLRKAGFKFLKPSDNLISDDTVEFLPHDGWCILFAVDEYGGSGSFLGTFVLESWWQKYAESINRRSNQAEDFIKYCDV
jgi:hypothetical protein